MSSELMLMAISEHEPVMMAKIATAMKMAEQIDPSFAAEAAQEISQVLDYTTEKVAAGWGDYARNVGAYAVSGLVGSVATDLYDIAKRKLTESGNYKNMLQLNHPGLAAHSPEQVRKAFDTVHKFAPEITSDPSTTSSVVNLLLQNPDNQFNVLKELINSRNNLRNARKSQFSMPGVGYQSHESQYGAQHGFQMKLEQKKHELAKELKKFEWEKGSK